MEPPFPIFDDKRTSAYFAARACLEAPDHTKPNALNQLAHAVDGLLRTAPTEHNGHGPNPRESDGVFLLDAPRFTASELTVRAGVWLVSTQMTTPVLIRFRATPEEPTTGSMVVQFGIERLTLPKADLERVWRRGRFPDEDGAWCLTLS